MKIKLFTIGPEENGKDINNIINNFIKDKKVIDIKMSTDSVVLRKNVMDTEVNICTTLLIMYEEK